MSDRHFDFVVVGSGPGGQKAAVCAAKEGQRVALVEQDAHLGGACVHHGTIPSKSLREVAIRSLRARRHEGASERRLEDVRIRELLGAVDDVVRSYAETVEAQMKRNGVEVIHGRASLLGPNEVGIQFRSGGTERVAARSIILATGSRPRHPDGVRVDHEHVLDADSILKLAYLPRSLAILGGGVIACEYASVFAALGVEVTIIDRGERPLAFLDHEISDLLAEELAAEGCRYLGGRTASAVTFDGVSSVEVALADGETICAEKVFVALGRTGCLESLNLEAAGLVASDRMALEIDEMGCTAVPGIHAVGDVAGPPALATSAMEEGRRAVMHALGREPGRFGGIVPTGIYTIPELASVGSTEREVRDAKGSAAVGRASFDDLARHQISGTGRGLLKVVADPDDGRLLGVHIAGEGATELVHIGQMALIAGATLRDLIEHVFNFPTLAEAYRVAALDCLNGMLAHEAKPEPAGARAVASAGPDGEGARHVE